MAIGVLGVVLALLAGPASAHCGCLHDEEATGGLFHHGIPGFHVLDDGVPGVDVFDDGIPGFHVLDDGVPGVDVFDDGIPGFHVLDDGLFDDGVFGDDGLYGDDGLFADSQPASAREEVPAPGSTGASLVVFVPDDTVVVPEDDVVVLTSPDDDVVVEEFG